MHHCKKGNQASTCRFMIPCRTSRETFQPAVIFVLCPARWQRLWQPQHFVQLQRDLHQLLRYQALNPPAGGVYQEAPSPPSLTGGPDDPSIVTISVLFPISCICNILRIVSTGVSRSIMSKNVPPSYSKDTHTSHQPLLAGSRKALFLSLDPRYYVA